MMMRPLITGAAVNLGACMLAGMEKVKQDRIDRGDRRTKKKATE
jgi:hypothetical protein